jgi:hypothetical protein
MTFSCSSVILLFLKKEAAAVLKSSKMEGVRFPFSNIGASLPPMKVVSGASPGREGTEVEDMMLSKEESGDRETFEGARVLALLGGSQDKKGGGSEMFRLWALVLARIESRR